MDAVASENMKVLLESVLAGTTTDSPPGLPGCGSIPVSYPKKR